MKRRSFFGALSSGLIFFANPVLAFAKAKPTVEPFWDWTCSLRQSDGKIVTKVLHLQPRSTAPKELTYDGKRFAIVSSDFEKRTSLYRYSPSLDERVAKYLAEHDLKASGVDPIVKAESAHGKMFAGEDGMLPALENIPMSTRLSKDIKGLGY